MSGFSQETWNWGRRQMTGLVIFSKIVIGMLLLFTGIAKTLDLAAFARVVRAFGLLPPKASAIFARLVPFAEIGIAVCLLSGWCTPWAGITGASLFGLFSVAVVLALIRGRSDLHCGCCGSRRGAPLGYTTVLRNLGLIALALLGCGVRWAQPSVVILALVVCLTWLTALAGISRGLRAPPPESEDSLLGTAKSPIN
jgi:uncharacterized membrane protein YphA (DoxX/SURF4 family)